METNTIHAEAETSTLVIPPAALLEHWQGHRRLTRRMIEAFPEDRFFDYSIGGMRPFAAMVLELLSMADVGVDGILTGKWPTVEELDHHSGAPAPTTREEILRRWDNATAEIDRLWPQIPPGRFQEVDLVYGRYESPIYSAILYWIDNEVHHRGQGYVYLRSLGIEPPAFWER